MPVAMQWLLDRHDLALTLVEGDGRDRMVSWAHAIELEDPTPWLRGEELVLTTGLRLPRSVADQVDYVHRLAAADVAGLAFGVGVRFERIPPTVVRACRETGLPLLEVPLPTPFIAITQAVAARLAEQQLESLQRAVNHQQQLTRTAARHGVVGLVRTLSRELGCAAVLLDEWGGTLAATSAGPSLPERVHRELSRHSWPAAGRGSIGLVDEHGSLEIQTLRGRSAVRGWLAVETSHPLSATDRLVVNQAVSLLTVQLDRPRELVETYRRLGATVLDLLLDADPVQAGLLGHLRHFGFDPAESVVVVAVTAERDEPVLAETVVDRLDASDRPHLLTSAGNDLVVLARAADSALVVERVAAGLADARRHDSTIGVSAWLRPEHVAGGLLAARQAGVAARRQRVRVGWFDRLTLSAIVADETVRERLLALVGPKLAPLLVDRRSEELLRSLEAFLQHNGSWETASRAVGVHRHTLRNRMAEVQRLTGMDLEVAEDRVVLFLALMTRPSTDQPGCGW